MGAHTAYGDQGHRGGERQHPSWLSRKDPAKIVCAYSKQLLPCATFLVAVHVDGVWRNKLAWLSRLSECKREKLRLLMRKYN